MVCIGVVSFAHAQAARAATSLQLDWDSPDDCRVASAVQSTVERMVKGVPTISQRVKVVLTRNGAEWAATLHLQQGTRRLEGASCEELAETVAVVIALAIERSSDEPRFAEITPPATNSVPAEQETASAPSPQPRDAVMPEGNEDVSALPQTQSADRKPSADSDLSRPRAPVRRSPLTLGGGVGVLGEVGALPRVAAAGSVGLRIAGPSWAARLRWAAFFSQQAERSSRSVGTISLAFGAVEPCVAARWLANRWEFCGSFEYGPMSGSGKGNLQEGKSGSTSWYALGSAVGGWFRLVDHLYLEPRLGAAFPLFHPAFTIDTGTPVHQVGMVSGRAELNLWIQY